MKAKAHIRRAYQLPNGARRLKVSIMVDRKLLNMIDTDSVAWNWSRSRVIAAILSSFYADAPEVK